MTISSLGEEDLRHVIREVSSLKSAYYQLGVELGVPPSELDAVKVMYNQNLEQALTEVLLLWLRRRSPLYPTWQNLVMAVASANNGINHGLAVAIASRHS